MKKNIAVETGLTSIADYLSDSGYKVFEVDTSQTNNRDFLNSFDAVVLTGMDINLIGDQKTYTKAPIIEARGLTPQEVKKVIEQKLS